MKTCLSFIRRDINHIHNMVVLRFKHKKTLKTPPEVLNAFTNSITKWVENTQEGKDVWSYSSQDLNIGDILGEYKNPMLNKYLCAKGIKNWKPIYELVDEEEVSYDKVLASPKENI